MLPTLSHCKHSSQVSMRSTGSCKCLSSCSRLWHSIFPISSCFRSCVVRSHNLIRLPQAIWPILTPWCTLLRFVALLCLRVRARLGGLLARFSTRSSWPPKSQLNTLDSQRNFRSSCSLAFSNSFWKKSVSFHCLELWTAPSSSISLIGWLVWEFPCWNQKLFILFV